MASNFTPLTAMFTLPDAGLLKLVFLIEITTCRKGLIMKSSFVYVLLLLIFYCAVCSGSAADCIAADGVVSWMGDGSCDPQNLSSECDWDGGDCCECTCEDESFACGVDGYLCPDHLEDGSCEEKHIPACSTEDQPLVVENTSQALSLAVELNCSGGTFHVEWRGSVVVDTEIVVSYGTLLNVTGVGSNAVIESEGKMRLFRVVNASLLLNGVEIRNGNATFGGAIAAMGSTLTLHRTSFIGNTATEKNGGAVFLYRSSVSFSGQTDFFNNSAKYGGALYAVSNSSITWEGVSNFTGNSAIHSGGALGIVVGSTAIWEAETTFKRNVATTYRGGALFLEGGSSASWGSNANFIANSARLEGGAVFVDLRSNASWSGDTRFFSNSVTYGGGGAILIADSSTVRMTGETMFEFNSCTSEGGAISSRALDSSVSTSLRSQESSLRISGPAMFSNNECGSNGGGLALLDGRSATFTSNVTFVGNEASVAGGGVYISATGEGPVFNNVSFHSNSAQVGGGVFVTGSGTSVDISFKESSATFVKCEFIKNKAESTGGAIEIATGTAAVKDTLFKGNEAGVGGALRLAGATSLEECIFEENISELNGGQAISMIGYSLDMENCTFRGNVNNCTAGTFLNESGIGSRFSAICSGCDDIDCTNCEIEKKNNVSTCSTALEHSSSSGGTSVTLQTLMIDPGYWRATNDSINILACYNEDACEGGLTGSLTYCSKGHKGPYCSVCTDDYIKGAEFTCTKCSENVWGIVVALIFLVVAMAGTVAAVKYLTSINMRARRGIISRIMRRIPLHSVKIIIVAWQILTQFATVADVTYPGIYERFLDIVNTLNFDLTWMISAGCFITVDFHGHLLIMTIGPIIVMLFLGGTYTYVMCKHRASEDAVTIIQHKHVSVALLVMFLVYSSTSSAVFQMFDCEHLDDGKNYLRADYTIECDSPRHRALMSYAAFMVALYPLGIPSFFGYLLFRNRKVLTNETGRKKASSVKSISDLWEPYKPSRFYYEVIECVRRIVLTGAILIVDDDSAAQIAVTLTLAFVFTVISEGLAPYESKLDAWVSRLGHAVVVSSMYYALLLKVDVSEESQASQRAFEIVLVSIHISMILAVIGETILTGYLVNRGEQVELPWPRFRRYRWARVHVTTRSMSIASIATHDSMNNDTIEDGTQQPDTNGVYVLDFEVRRG